MLASCASAPPSPALQASVNSCAPVVPCVLTASSATTNGDLLQLIDRIEADWAICAAQVDAVVTCQQQANEVNHAQAR
ncbi:Rz1-like lysis system protein LysC [Bordetella sp. 2513F-2]